MFSLFRPWATTLAPFLITAAIALGAFAQPARAAGPTLNVGFQPVLAQPDTKVSFTGYFSNPVGAAGTDLTVGPDGNLWITTTAGTIVRMTPHGVSTSFQYASGGAGYSPAPGPDGSVWFVDERDDLVGKVTTAGVVTTYPLPTDYVSGCNVDAIQPQGITAGPDGAMWFTVSEGDGGSLGCPQGQPAEIGRITTGGQMTFYDMPALNGNPYALSPLRIIAGPDGLLWFTTNTDQNGATLGVGSITTGGAITVSNGFPGLNGESYDYLTFGADHKLYVTDSFGGNIVRVSNYKAVATFPVPGGAHPDGITSRASGDLWFTTNSPGELGSMTTRGKFTLYPFPPSFGSGYGGGLAFREKQLWLPNNGNNPNIIKAIIH